MTIPMIVLPGIAPCRCKGSFMYCLVSINLQYMSR